MHEHRGEDREQDAWLVFRLDRGHGPGADHLTGHPIHARGDLALAEDLVGIDHLGAAGEGSDLPALLPDVGQLVRDEGVLDRVGLAHGEPVTVPVRVLESEEHRHVDDDQSDGDHREPPGRDVVLQRQQAGLG